MSDVALFVLLALATHRVLRFVQRDRLTLRPREALFNRFPPNAQRQHRVAKWEPKLLDVAYHPRANCPKVSRLGYWLACPWCLGAWLSAVAVLLADRWASLPLPVAWWLALSSAVALLSTMED